MDRFVLPHSHGERNSESMHRQAADIGRFSSVAEVFKQLSDITRVRIFWLLSHKEECVINIAAMLDMSSPAVSHHLRGMCDSGLLVSRRDGKEVYYRVRDSKMSRLLHDGIEQMMEISCPERAMTADSTSRELAHGVHDYMEEHISERITIDELSRRFLINPTSLKRIFKEEYGDSIASHMKRHRMELARELLGAGGRSVSDVASEVGYESQSKFSSAFKECYGILPTEYKRRHSENDGACCKYSKSSKGE